MIALSDSLKPLREVLLLMGSAFICIRAHLKKCERPPECKLSLTSDQDPIQNAVSPSSAVCQQASSRIPVPLFAEGGGKDINETSIDFTSLESPSWLHTCCHRYRNLSSIRDEDVRPGKYAGSSRPSR